MEIVSVDHVVLTVRDMCLTITFYQDVLGMAHLVFDGHHNALQFGSQKINLHHYRNEYSPHALVTLPGTADLCFINAGPMESVVEVLRTAKVDIELGPVDQIGSLGPMRSVYFRDPDQNLIEVACYPST